MGWSVTADRGPASDLHERLTTPVEVRRLRLHEVTDPALVLGSTQALDVVDVEAAEDLGLEIVRRRSGGGTVLLRPHQVVWADVEIPRDDVLWRDEPTESARWFGELWSESLRDLGLAAVTHDSRPEAPWSRLCCFAGLGWGEVAVGGAKVVGIAQRRSRTGVRLQSLAFLADHDPGEVVSFLRLDPSERAALARQLRASVTVLDVDADALVASLRARLP